MPLIIAPENVELRIVKVLVSDEKTKRHLENLGVLTNSIITILSRQHGDIIVKVKDGRLALNKETAEKIHVA